MGRRNTASSGAIGAAVCVLAVGLGACARPFLASDGTLVFAPPGTHGASVITANGVEFHDVTDVPERVVVRDPYEAWRAPLGFLVPKNGRFTMTSQPTLVATPGLAVVLRPSDTRVPSWGGEMLVRVDVMAPAAVGAARWGQDVAIVLGGRGADARTLAGAAVEQLGARDRVEVVDASAPAGPGVVVPTMPASHRSLVMAAIDRALASKPRRGPVDHAAVVAMARAGLSAGSARRVLVLGDSAAPWTSDDDAVPLAVVALTGAGGVAASDAAFDGRLQAVRDFVPPAGAPAFSDVVLAFDGTPAPSHVLEASGGDARWEFEGGELAFGDLRAGDERTEVVRVTIPAWTPGEAFALHVAVRFADAAHPGVPRTMSADLRCVYDDDVERLANSRHGDVIAYASALATLSRLDAAFVGGAHARDLRPVAQMHARSLSLLARDMHDPAAAEQAALLEALLSAVP